MSFGAARAGDGPVLLIGASGQVGRRLSEALRGRCSLIALTRDDLDLRDDARIRATVRQYAPSVVINSAAYTRVDDAEREREACWAINAIAPGILAAEAARTGALSIDFSTNYVFAGDGDSAYREQDDVHPLSEYGRSKAEGERRIATENPRHLIIRTHGIYDQHGINFLRRILALAHEREELRVVHDQIGAPTPAVLIAGAVADLLDRASHEGWNDEDCGILHLTTSGEASWYDFAARALALDPQRAGQRCTALHAIASSEFVTPACRPLNGRLDTHRARAHFGLSLPSWDAALEEVLQHWETA